MNESSCQYVMSHTIYREHWIEALNCLSFVHWKILSAHVASTIQGVRDVVISKNSWFLAFTECTSSGRDRYELNGNGNESIIAIEIRAEKGSKPGLTRAYNQGTYYI